MNNRAIVARANFAGRFTVIAFACLTGAPGAHAQDETKLVVPEVVVSGTRSQQSTVTVPASIEVISREEIESSGATHVVDVLRGRGAVQVTDQFGDGSRVFIGIRGFGETANANTLLLIDGRRLNNPDIGNPDLNSISLADVERIEIIRGSAGTLFGDQAVGGVVNIITRKARRKQLYIAGTGASHGSGVGRAIISQRFDNGLDYRVSGEVRRSDNFRDHNDLNYQSFFAQAGFAHRTGAVFAELQHVTEDLNTPGPLTAAEAAADRQQSTTNFATDFVDTETTVVRIGGSQDLIEHWSFEGELTNRESESQFRLSSVFGPEPSVSPQSRHVVQVTPRLVGAYPIGAGNLLVTLGYDLEQSDYDITSRFGTQRNEQTQHGLYAQAVVPVTSYAEVTVGARNAKVENALIDSGAFAVFPGGAQVDDEELVTEVGVSVSPIANLRVFGRRDENVRFAKVEENLFTFLGGPLNTQTGVSWEAGAEWNDGRRAASVVVYRLDLDNEIAFDPGTFTNLNLAQTRRDGLILDGRWQATGPLGLAVGYSFVEADVLAGAFQGFKVPFVAEHFGRFSADYRVNPSWQIFGEVQTVGDRVFSGDFTNALGELVGYTVLNAKAQYQYRQYKLELRVNNLLAEEYSDFGARIDLFPAPLFTATPTETFFPSPQRTFWFTLSARFD